jgi:hypothetical protein
MTTDELRDELARMAGWTRLRQPDGFADGWRHADGDRAMTHPIPSTLDGLVEIWPDNMQIALHRSRNNDGEQKWSCGYLVSSTWSKTAVDAALVRILERVKELETSYPTAYAAWQRKVQEQAR